MKRTIYLPVILGTLLGLLAGIATITGLSFLMPGAADTDNAIGFYMSLILLSAALGGPLAGVLTSTIFVTTATLYGPPDIKSVLSDPIVFWSNVIVLAVLAAGIGFAYVLIYERLKMPRRLLAWAGIVIGLYLLNPIFIIGSQFYLTDLEGTFEAILSVYRLYIPQTIFDILFTSLVFVALPGRYRRPQWKEPLSVTAHTAKMTHSEEK